MGLKRQLNGFEIRYTINPRHYQPWQCLNSPAEAFEEHHSTIGFDIDRKKTDLLTASGSKIRAMADPNVIQKSAIIMICVPTPVTKAKDPDRGQVTGAARTVGKNLKEGAIVVLESMVYSGVTEEFVVPILKQESGLHCGKDFFVGYSPERINPNDDEHTLEKTTKIVSGMDEKTADTLCQVYGLVTTVYRAPDIRTTEAAKVIENIQRDLKDLNIALVNELSLIFPRVR